MFERTDLVERINQGDATAINELVELLRPLVVSKVDALLASDAYRQYRYIQEDIVSDCCLSMIEQLHAVASDEAKVIHNAPTYICGLVHRHCREFIRNKCKSACTTSADVNPLTEDDDSFEMAEQLRKCCTTEREQTILEMRIKRHTQVDIAQHLGITRFTVNKDLRRIRERWEGHCATA